MTPTLALWQGAGVPGDLAATVEACARIAAEAADAGAGLLVFPEGYLTGYRIDGLAPGGLLGVEDALAAVGRIAGARGIAIVLGTHLAEAGGVRNAAVAFDPSGAEIGRYAKRALFGDWERATFAPGTGTLRFVWHGLRVGVLICYDVEFPELVRAEAAAGADLVVVPTALMAPHHRIAREMIAVRAMENQIFLGYANRSGAEAGLDYVGLSLIADPDGAVLAQAGAEPALLFAPIDPARIAASRGAACYLDDLDRIVPPDPV